MFKRIPLVSGTAAHLKAMDNNPKLTPLPKYSNDKIYNKSFECGYYDGGHYARGFSLHIHPACVAYFVAHIADKSGSSAKTAVKDIIPMAEESYLIEPPYWDEAQILLGKSKAQPRIEASKSINGVF